MHADEEDETSESGIGFRACLKDRGGDVSSPSMDETSMPLTARSSGKLEIVDRISRLFVAGCLLEAV